MTLTRFLAATCSILALAGCGTSQSSPPAESAPPADAAAASSAQPAAEATPPAGDAALASPPPPDTARVEDAGAETATASSSTPRVLTATDRLTDPEVKALLASIETRRAAFEAALDDKLKNSTIKAPRGEVKTNEFFDDLQDQVERAQERFGPDYSASSEVLPLLQQSARLDAWASTQPAGFRGSKEWGVLASDLRRLSAAYNSGLLRPGRKGLGEQARRLNDAELVTVAANVEKNMDAFRKAYDSALAANANLTAESRKAAIQNVDAMKNSARALNAALGKKQKGLAEANALLKTSGVMIAATLDLPPSSSAAAAWAPVRDELTKVALGYEVILTR